MENHHTDTMQMTAVH